MDTIPEPTDTPPQHLDLEATRRIVDEYVGMWTDHGEDTEQKFLDALKGCVRPVPPATIERREVWRLVNAMPTNLRPSYLSEVADQIVDLIKSDPRFDAIRQLHQPYPGGGMGYSPDSGGTYGSMSSVCSACGTPDEYGETWPCATVRALNGEQDAR